ncbi:metal-dependent hydrolase family protein [Gimibacter soli]|uniref:Amidohydrolase family protein n=1 Tax=Gimibacter soli TaxID=3024400 RepID=A0AAE9XTV6_9PROT|nr:amidohydrolase family protein [Gimibacter soli]WCL55165.1 amidohydrolase family protein [Gimibacter soli]
MKKLMKLAAVALMAGASTAAMAETTVIHAGELLAVPGKASLKAQTLVIEDGKVKAVVDGYQDAASFGADAKYLDLKDRFVMPGMMDMHVHLQGELGGDRYRNQVLLSKEDVGMQSIMYAQRTLDAGFTTVRDCGSDTDQMFAFRDAVEKGWVMGPRIIAAGHVGITGGHVDVDGMNHELLDLYTNKEELCDGADDCTRATRHAIKYGADLIKIASTGGVLSDIATGTGQQMTDDEIKAVVEAAHAMGRKVASHAHAAAGINAALRAGVDSIEHGSYADDETFKLFKKTGAYLVPTLLAGQTVVDLANNTDVLSPAQEEKALAVGEAMKANIGKAVKAGVKIAYGTDSGVSHHGDNAREAVLMVEAGMTPMQVLESATVAAADLIGKSDSLGTLEPGKAADIIATSASPLGDIKELLDVDFVMKGGKVVKQK